MSVPLPAWQPLARGAGSWIEDSPDAGRVVALLAPARSSGESWVGAATYALAAEWAETGRRVVLTDAALEEPSLHELADLENAEGLVDATCFGSSVAHVARSVPGHSFFLITAGSPVADGASIAESPRWRRLLDGFRQAGVTLVLFLREGGAGVSAFLREAEDVVLLVPAPGSEPVPGDGVDARVRAVVGPPEGTTAGVGGSADGAGTGGPDAEEHPAAPFAAPIDSADATLAGPGGPADAALVDMDQPSDAESEGTDAEGGSRDARADLTGRDAPAGAAGAGASLHLSGADPDGERPGADPAVHPAGAEPARSLPSDPVSGTRPDTPLEVGTGRASAEAAPGRVHERKRARDATGSSLLFWLLLGGLALAFALVLLI